MYQEAVCSSFFSPLSSPECPASVPGPRGQGSCWHIALPFRETALHPTSPVEVCLTAQNRWKDILPLELCWCVLLLLLPNAKNDKNLLCVLGGGEDQIELCTAVRLLVGQDSQGSCCISGSTISNSWLCC